MNKLTESEIALLEKYENASDENREKMRELISLPYIEKHFKVK